MTARRKDAHPRTPRARSARMAETAEAARRQAQRDAAASDDPLAKQFLAYCRIECGFSPATLDAYGRDLRSLATWLRERGCGGLESATTALLTEHLRDLHRRGLNVSTLARHIATFRVFGRYLHANGLRPDNPADDLAQPVPTRHLPGVLSPAQMRRLVEAPDPEHRLFHRDRALLELLYAGGLRATELAELEVDRVHFDLGVVRIIGKGRRERVVPIGRPAIEATRQYLEQLRPDLLNPARPTGRLLLSQTGTPIDRIVVWQIVRRQARRAGLAHVHPHTLRHCFATHLLGGGADLRVVQELLGHANIQTTQIYTHVDRSHLKGVIDKFHPRP